MAAPTSYSRLQIGLHWLIAISVVLLWLIEEEAVHIPLGIAMAALLALRVVIRAVRGAPGPTPGTSPTLARAAHLGHLALYLAMGLSVLFGLLDWLTPSGLAKEAHELSSNALMLLALGHALAAIWHQWIARDGTLDRMRLRGN